ncbi:MAG TPA: class I SAM-dependent methyltransferase [Candidatus Baltobacteraceae bacterium]|jgi:predicted O-methyltransferase YrrM
MTVGKSDFIDQSVQEYILSQTVHETAIQRALREETSHRSNAQMQIGPDQAQFMALLAHIIGARRYLEIGVFTGYSTLAMALALPSDGRIVACDVSEEYTSVARRYWEQAGVAGKIDLRLAPALETLERIVGEKTEPFDMAFIDADKENVAKYFEYCLQLVRPGGLILVDNVLWSGRVANSSVNDADTCALRNVSVRAANDDRVEVSLVPICDGILIARKR